MNDLIRIIFLKKWLQQIFNIIIRFKKSVCIELYIFFYIYNTFWNSSGKKKNAITRVGRLFSSVIQILVKELFFSLVDQYTYKCAARPLEKRAVFNANILEEMATRALVPTANSG